MALPARHFHYHPTWEHLGQLVREHVHSVSLGGPTGVRINFQSRLEGLQLFLVGKRELLHAAQEGDEVIDALVEQEQACVDT